MYNRCDREVRELYPQRHLSGVHMLGSVEPTLKEHSLFYDGEYLKVGEGRAAITEDKISDDSARLCTMAGIAMELKSAGINKAEVVLAAGLPFFNYGRDKIKLIDYYEKQPELDFSYEGEDYSVTIWSWISGAKPQMLCMCRMGFRLRVNPSQSKKQW